MNIEKWLQKNAKSLEGKTVAITGATGGLGEPVCRYILKLGGSLLMLNRSKEKTEKLKNKLLAEFPEAKIDSIMICLDDIDSVKKATEEIKKFPVDFFVINAGAYSIPRKVCSTGYDNVFQINFASHYYMAKELMPILKERKGKILAVGSIAHTYSKSDLNDIDFKGRKGASLVYGNSKRYLMFALTELMKENTDVQFSIAHPGITFTNITSHYPKVIFAIIKYPMKVIFTSPKITALSVIKGLCTQMPYDTWVGPRAFNIWGKPSVKKLNTVKEAERKSIYKSAEDIYKKLKSL